jgi:hypothetical protein
MPNDPHRDALAAALARVAALEQENRELRDGSGGHSSPESAPPSQPSQPTPPTGEEVALVSTSSASGPDSIDFDAVQAMVGETLSDPSLAKDPAGRRVPAPKPQKKAKPKATTVKCDACGSPRTSVVLLAGPAKMVSPRPGVAERIVQNFPREARACADCGQVAFQLPEKDRDWLRKNERAAPNL